jgi:hypothetical protein
MAHLDTLTRQGLRATVQPGGKLRLEPDWLITDEVRRIVREHRDDIIAEACGCGEHDPQGAREIVPDYHILWVATDLDSFEEFDPRFGHEIDCTPVYRMLDAAYYAWLRHRMENAKKAHDAGRLDDETFEVLRTRFNTIHTWAVRHIGAEELRKAVRTTNTKSYVPPSDDTFAAYRRTWDEAWVTFRKKMVAPRDARCSGACTAPPNSVGPGSSKNGLPAEAVAKVDAIRDQAMALGWTEEGLYGNSGKHTFPCGDGYGVVMFVGRNREIGEVTAEAIEIIQKHERHDGTAAYTSLRHYNPDVRQLWRKISGQEASATEAKSASPAHVRLTQTID